MTEQPRQSREELELAIRAARRRCEAKQAEIDARYAPNTSEYTAAVRALWAELDAEVKDLRQRYGR